MPSQRTSENQEQVDKLLQILPQCPTIRLIVYDNDRSMRHYEQSLLISYAALLQRGQKALGSKRDLVEAEAARGEGQGSAFVFFTPGTTGPAKGVVLSHASLIDRGRAVTAAEGVKDTDVAMAYLPPAWLGQIFFSYVQPMVAGYCICCPESAETMLTDMREMGPTYLLATPRILETLLTQVSIRADGAGGINRRLYLRCIAAGREIAVRRMANEAVPLVERFFAAIGEVLIYAPLRDAIGLSKVRVAYVAGDIVAPDLLVFFRALGIDLKPLYGSTETGFLIAMQRDGELKVDSVGRAAEGVELKITPQREVLVRSPGLFKEYYRDPEATRKARNAEGWFHTGDAGYLGEDGHLRIIDRVNYVGALKDGTSYAPKPIENRLKLFHYFKEAIVFGDGRDKVCALVDIDMAAVSRWADKQGHRIHRLCRPCFARSGV